MRAVIFWEDGFPCQDCTPLKIAALKAAFRPEDSVEFAGLDRISAALADRPDLFVSPYGSAFPKAAWSAFTDYLLAGGNWVNLGGAPLTRPVRREGDEWHVEVEQTAYGKELFLNHVFKIDLPKEATLRCPPLDVDLETHFHLFQPTRAWSLQVRFSDRKDFQDEGGSGGRREAVIHPLAVYELDGRVLAAPVVAIDRLAGDFAGGRWVLACCEGARPLPADLIERLCRYAVRERATLEVRSSFACYYPGEMPVITVTAKSGKPANLKINLRVYSRETQKEVYAHIFQSQSGVGPAIVQTSPFPAGEPGLYITRVSVEVADHSKPIAYAESGFWVYDKPLMTSGLPLTTDRDYFYRDGKPFPVTGTTYMSGDTHRKFLFEPNPAVWDADFAAMKLAGVNMVRTGIWTGWKRVMLDPGAIDEGVLRALAAFLLTARRYDIPVIFTFFAFIPEMWGGENPYLDPLCIDAQSSFIAAFARRFANVNDLLWDFINEPSFCSPEQVWKTRPNYDRFERAAWSEWLAKQGVSDDEWRERWRLTPNDPLDLPALEDFEDRYIYQGTHPLQVMDYMRFAQEKFAEWAATMRDVIRENGNANQLVTVGQDEGGTRDRPNPHFHSHVVDFTTNHSWWQNDDLLWDSLITKTLDKPNLIQETGIMFVETPDGRAWRTPEECRNLLERKMALSFAGGCAGFIQWLWNTNVYMDSDNEVGIGFLRADGSEKPELEAFRGVARFFRENAHLMVGRKLEEAVVIIPHSNMFSVRNLADRATRVAVRTLEYGLGIPCRCVSEYRADDVGDAKLIVLPCARNLTEKCWQTLLSKVEAGATLLATGYIDADEYWRPVERLKRFGLETKASPVYRTELVKIAYHGETGLPYELEYGGDSIQKLDRIHGWDGDDAKVIQCGTGKLILHPVPVELGSPASWAPIYDLAALKAFPDLPIERRHAFFDTLVHRVEYAQHSLLIVVGESATDYDLTKKLQVNVAGANWRICAGRITLAFVERATGTVVAQYP